VVGGLTGEDLDLARDARWVIPRRFALSREEKRVQAALIGLVQSGGYEPLVIDYPDTVFQNRETLRSHRFRTAPRNWPRVVIFRRKG
jgi:hypothetical protein